MSEHDRDDSYDDDLDDFLADAMENPIFAAAHEDAAERSQLLRQLVAHRKRSRCSQTAVAKAMGTTQSAVSDLEGGGTDPRLSTMQRYARAMGCRFYIDVVSEAGERIYASPRPYGTPLSGTIHIDVDEFVKNLGAVFKRFASATPLVSESVTESALPTYVMSDDRVMDGAAVTTYDSAAANDIAVASDDLATDNYAFAA